MPLPPVLASPWPSTWARLAKPLVKKGDAVLQGQAIGAATASSPPRACPGGGDG